MKTLSELFAIWRSREIKINDLIAQLRQNGVTETSVFEEKLKAELGDEYPNYWFKVICDPIAEQIKEAGGFAHVKVLGPMGIGARVSFHCYAQESDEIEKISSLTVEPNLDEEATTPLSLIDYNTKSERFEKGTLGEVNGLNYGTVEIDPETSGEKWLALLEGPQEKVAV